MNEVTHLDVIVIFYVGVILFAWGGLGWNIWDALIWPIKSHKDQIISWLSSQKSNLSVRADKDYQDFLNWKKSQSSPSSTTSQTTSSTTSTTQPPKV